MASVKGQEKQVSSGTGKRLDALTDWQANHSQRQQETAHAVQTGKAKRSFYNRWLAKAGDGAIFEAFAGTGTGPVAKWGASKKRRIIALEKDGTRASAYRTRNNRATVVAAKNETWLAEGHLPKDLHFAVADFDATGRPFPAIKAFFAAYRPRKKMLLFATFGWRHEAINLSNFDRKKAAAKAQREIRSAAAKVGCSAEMLGADGFHHVIYTAFAVTPTKEVTKALRPSLKVPDPDHLISRLAKREVAGILSRVDRAAFLDKDFILVNERLKEGEPTKAWGVVRLRTGVRFRTGTQAVETLGQKLDSLTRREFRQEKDPVYFHSLMLVERFDSPREVEQQAPGRRFTGQVDVAEKQVDPEKLADLGLDDLLDLLRMLDKEFVRRKEEGATEASSEDLVNAAVFVLGELSRRGEKPPDLPIVQAAGALLKADVRITTSTDAGHSHTAIVDEDTGDGETTVNNGHKHGVDNWRVLPGGSDDHTHTIERPAVKAQFAPVAASGAESGKVIKLGDVLPAFETALLRKPAVMLVGGLAVRKETKNDIDILIRGPMDEATRHVIKFRVGRMLAAKNPELADRIQFHDDQYGGPFTDFVELFDLALVARDKPEVIQMRAVEKQGDPLLELLPKGAGPADAVYQLHYRGASVHGDLRMKINDHLIGWTMAVQKAGAVPDTNTVEQGKKGLEGLTLEGNRIHKSLLAPSRVRSFPKKRQPVAWLEARDQVIDPGDVGATAEEEGVLVIADRPKFEQGIQSSRFHEYFFTGKGKLLQGVMFSRLLASGGGTPRETEEGTRTREGETFWVTSFSKDALPSILSTRAVRRGVMPPSGRSWIPQTLERVTPEEFRYWEKTGAAAKKARDELVKSRFFTDANVKVVDGQFRRVVEKRYVDLKGLAPSKPSPPEPVAKQRSVDFSLAWQTFKGPAAVRTGPTQQAWWLMWPTDGRVAAFRLETDPMVETGDIAATFREMSDKELMTFEGALEPGKEVSGFVPNPTKDTPSQWRIVDKGKMAVLDEEPGKIRFSLKGENLKGVFLLEQEERGAALWKLKREGARKIKAIVLEREQQGPGWVYSVGVGPVSKDEAAGWKNTVEVNGQVWVNIGKTLPTKVDASPEKTIQVSIAKLLLDTRDPRSLTWSTPVVKGVIEGRPSTTKEVEALARPDEIEKLADLPFTRPLPLLKSDSLQYVLGIVLEPNDGKDGAPLAPDAQSDIYSEDEIRKAAWLFMRKYQGLGLMHEREATKREMEIVESYLAPVDFTIDGQKIRKGTWLLGAKIHSPELWAKIKRGEIGAWSIDGEAVRQPLDAQDKAA